MHVRTDHDECVAMLFCDHCIVTVSVATYSPFFTEVLTDFTSVHATCATQGHPDFGDVGTDQALMRARAVYRGVDLIGRPRTLVLP